MKTNSKIKTLGLMVMLVLPFYSGVTGNREGNGGDHVRGSYLTMGRAILGYLQKTKAGAELVIENGLDLAKIEDTLSIAKVAVVEGELKDNGGSDVDATGVPGKVTLRKEIWMDHFEKQRDVYYLVFHEMLRSAGYNDDNYVYSRGLDPFPLTHRVTTRINPLLPLVSGDSVETMLDTDQIGVNGTGCPISENGTYVDFDPEHNILEINLDRYKVKASPTGMLADSRKACSIAVPLTVPPGKRLVISQLDVTGKVNLPIDSKSTINLEAFVAGATGPKVKKVVAAETQDEVGRVQIRLTNFYSTACGGYPILRLNTSGSVSAPSGATAAMKVDRVALYFKVEDCSR
jgi:hypothetical protein